MVKDRFLFFPSLTIRAITSAINGYAIINPPVKPRIIFNPPRNPANTGNPIMPSITYVNTDRNACFGGSNAAVKKIANKEKVNGIG